MNQNSSDQNNLPSTWEPNNNSRDTHSDAERGSTHYDASYGFTENWLETPLLFEGVLWRRSVAFIMDAVILLLLIGMAMVLTVAFVVLTFFTTAWLLPFVFPVVALLYFASSVSGPHQATPGMRMMDIAINDMKGTPLSWSMAAAHALCFYISIMPYGLTLLIGLFTKNNRLVHDWLVGSVVFRRSLDRRRELEIL